MKDGLIAVSSGKIFLAPFLLITLFTNTAALADLQDGLAAYRNGIYSYALKEFRPLAANGNTEAQFQLGLMYDYGMGIVQDDRAAVEWYRKAAEQGYALAQFNLGLIYAKNQGVPVDIVQAYVWFYMAAAGEYEAAKIYMEEFEKVMSGEQLTSARAQIREMISRSRGIRNNPH